MPVLRRHFPMQGSVILKDVRISNFACVDARESTPQFQFVTKLTTNSPDEHPLPRPQTQQQARNLSLNGKRQSLNPCIPQPRQPEALRPDPQNTNDAFSVWGVRGASGLALQSFGALGLSVELRGLKLSETMLLSSDGQRIGLGVSSSRDDSGLAELLPGCGTHS